jgi:hypothetical protein
MAQADIRTAINNDALHGLMCEFQLPYLRRVFPQPDAEGGRLPWQARPAKASLVVLIGADRKMLKKKNAVAEIPVQ